MAWKATTCRNQRYAQAAQDSAVAVGRWPLSCVVEQHNHKPYTFQLYGAHRHLLLLYSCRYCSCCKECGLHPSAVTCSPVYPSAVILLHTLQLPQLLRQPSWGPHQLCPSQRVPRYLHRIVHYLQSSSRTQRVSFGAQLGMRWHL